MSQPITRPINTIQSITAKALIASVLIVFFVAFFAGIFFSYKNSLQEQISNRKKIHEVMAGLLTPSLTISDTTEVKRILGLISTSNDEFFGVISKNGDLFLHDYNVLDASSPLVNTFGKIDGCNKIQDKDITLNSQKYTLLCTPLYSSQDSSYTSNQKQRLGELISFAHKHSFMLSLNLFAYFISVASITLLMMFFLIKTIMQKKFISPLIKLKDKISIKASNPIGSTPELGEIGDAPYEIEEIKKTFEVLLTNLKNEVDKRNESDRRSALYHLAAQVAHDIRSPLAALNMAIKLASTLPEDQRLIISNVAQRINDIANNLLQQHTNDGTDLTPISINKKNNASLLVSMLDSILSEKRTQYFGRDILLDLEIQEDTYAAFSKVDPIEFKRMISNIINNAVEAINKKGRIIVSLSKEAKNVVIKISDDGCGIPPNILAQLFKADVSFGKKDGHGIGLQHAHSMVSSWGGQISASSEPAVGTKIIIHLPMAKAPLWFTEEIAISPCHSVIILDDDASIHHVWEKRFSEFNNNKSTISLHHFNSLRELKNWIQAQKQDLKKYFFLVDHEIIGIAESGLDLISELEIAGHSILVTSRYEDPCIIARCEKLGVKILPKSMSVHIPIKICALGKKEK